MDEDQQNAPSPYDLKEIAPQSARSSDANSKLSENDIVQQDISASDYATASNEHKNEWPKTGTVSINQALIAFQADMRFSKFELWYDIATRSDGGRKDVPLEFYRSMERKLGIMDKTSQPELILKSLQMSGVSDIQVPVGRTSYERAINTMEIASNRYNQPDLTRERSENQHQSKTMGR